MTSGTSPPFRLVIISNRGPYLLHITPQHIRREKTIGGLVTSLLPMIEAQGGIWIAWGDPAGRYASGPRHLFDLRYIGLTPDQVKGYYQGFANNALWPLCHYFLGRVHYDEEEWQVYEQVNTKFAETTLQEATDEAVLWVHDYHLALVPCHLRRERPYARIAFSGISPFLPRNSLAHYRGASA